MTAVETLFLSQLRSVLFGEIVKLEMVNPETLSELLTLCARHSVTPIVAEGLSRHGLLQDRGVADLYRQFSYKAFVRWQQQEAELSRITELFEKYKVVNVLLKGSVIRNYYPEPWMRTSCDIDILIHEEQLKEAEKFLVSELGYRRENKTNHDVMLVAPNGVHLELHFDLDEKGLSLDDVWKTAVLYKGQYQFVFSPELFVMHHISHMAKHFILGGCGIRTLIDLWYLEKNLLYNREILKQKLSDNGLLKFYENVSALLSTWMTGEALTEQQENLLTFIVNGGVYGNRENRLFINQKMGKTMVLHLLSRIFPSLRSMRYLYPVLIKHPALLPFYYVIRLFSLMKPTKIHNAGEELKSFNNLNDETLSEATKILKQLGLR